MPPIANRGVRSETINGLAAPPIRATAFAVDRISVAKISEVDTHVKQVAPIKKSRVEKEHVNNNARGISNEANKHKRKTHVPPMA